MENHKTKHAARFVKPGYPSLFHKTCNTFCWLPGSNKMCTRAISKADANIQSRCHDFHSRHIAPSTHDSNIVVLIRIDKSLFTGGFLLVSTSYNTFSSTSQWVSPRVLKMKRLFVKFLLAVFLAVMMNAPSMNAPAAMKMELSTSVNTKHALTEKVMKFLQKWGLSTTFCYNCLQKPKPRLRWISELQQAKNRQLKNASSTSQNIHWPIFWVRKLIDPHGTNPSKICL